MYVLSVGKDISAGIKILVKVSTKHQGFLLQGCETHRGAPQQQRTFQGTGRVGGTSSWTDTLS